MSFGVACCGPPTVAPLAATTGPESAGIACYTPDGCCGPSPCAISEADFICAVRQLLPEGDVYNVTKDSRAPQPEPIGGIVICDDAPNTVGSADCVGEQLVFGGCCDAPPVPCAVTDVAPQLAVVDSFAAVLHGFVTALCKALCELDPCCSVDLRDRWARRFGIVRYGPDGCEDPFPDEVLAFLLCLLVRLKGWVFNLRTLEDLAALFGASLRLEYAGAVNCSYYGHYWTMARDRPACEPQISCTPELKPRQPVVAFGPCETAHQPDSINILLCPAERVFPANCNAAPLPALPHDPEYFKAFRWLLEKILPPYAFWCVYDCAPFDCPDTIPDAFAFADVTSASLSTVYESDAITVRGINAPTPLTIAGGEYSINGGAYASAPTTVNYFDAVRVRGTSSSAGSTAVNVVLTIGGISDTFTITTGIIPDTIPNAFAFTDVIDAARSAVYVSNPITVAGINVPSPLTIVGGEYSINGGAYASSPTTVNAGDIVTVRGTSSGGHGIPVHVVLTIGGVSDTYTITTVAADTTPDAFTFIDVTGATLNTVYVSNPITVTGINVPTPLTILGGEYSINGGPFVATAETEREINPTGYHRDEVDDYQTFQSVAMVNVGDTVTVRGTSSSANGTAVDVVLTIGGVSDTYTITTLVIPDTVPDAFAFTDVTDAAISTVYVSNPITVSGINVPTPLTIVGGEYSINGGSYAASATNVNAGDTVRVRGTSSAIGHTPVDVVVTIGGVSDAYTITTTGFSFTPLAYYDLSSVVQAGGLVSQWTDLGPNGIHLTRATGANQPAWDSAGQQIVFDGINDAIYSASFDFSAFPALCAFALVKVSTFGDSGILVLGPVAGNDYDASGAFFFYPYDPNTVRLHRGGGVIIGVTANVYQQIGAVHNRSGNEVMYNFSANTTQSGNVSDAAFTSTGVIVLGSRWTSGAVFCASFSIKKLMLTNFVPNSTQLDEIKAWLT